MSSSGYICNLIVYTGKRTVDMISNEAMGTKVVMDLMEPFLDKGYTLTVDNYYNSPELADILLKRKTDVYGTARPGRKDMPPFKDISLKKGGICAYQRGKCLALQWRDKKLVTFLSTIHSPTMQDLVKRRNVQVSKPIIALDYNNTMGGIDRSDQNLSY